MSSRHSYNDVFHFILWLCIWMNAVCVLSFAKGLLELAVLSKVDWILFLFPVSRKPAQI